MADKQTIVFSGENPGLTLYKPGTEQVIAAVSYWRCVYSEFGDGNATLIWVDPQESGLGDLAPHAIYTDNPRVGRLVADRFTQHFGTFKDLGFGEMETPSARFFQEGDGRWYHHVVTNTGDAVIDLNWWDIIQHELVQRTDYEVGPTKWDLATVICPCKSASIMVNNKSVTGEVRWKDDDSGTNSSAFLAFSETWRESP
ncbi:MAG: hypothetical protein M3439_12255 [Chloroflexota bacterium]|nr:hypothetical protein [Chloroflexota bacterium]